MAVAGVSTQSGPFRPCPSPGPSLWFSSPSLRRSLSGFSGVSPLPSQLPTGKIRSLQSSDAHCYDIARSGSMKSVRALGFAYRPVVMRDVVRIIDDPAYYCGPSSSPKFESSSSLINTNPYNLRPCLHGPLGTGIVGARDFSTVSKFSASDPFHSVSRWRRESKRLMFLRLSQHLCWKIANGRMNLEFLQFNIASQDRSAYKRVEISAASPAAHKLDAFVEKDVIRNSVTREYNSYSMESAQALAGFSQHIQSSVDSSNEISITRTVQHNKEQMNENPILSTKLSEFSAQTIRKSVPHYRPLPHKPLSDSKELLSEMAGVRPNDAISMDTADAESDSSEHFSEPAIEQKGPQSDNGIHRQEHQEILTRLYDKVLVVNNISTAKKVVQMLTTKYKNVVHACDTEVARIDVKQETPVGHGEIICFSIFSGSQADFGNGKSCIWVDVLDVGRNVLMEFAPFFEDPSIKKVWHNYSFDNHVIENYGIKVSGFHADTMHLARLWDSSRRTDGGYSLEGLTGDPKVMSGALLGWTVKKLSMTSIFGKKKVKKDGSEGKLITVAPVETLQRGERIPWICYSVSDSISTLKLYESLKGKLMATQWVSDGVYKGSMYDFYEKYWRPFGELLVAMESEGMLVDRAYLSKIEKVAVAEQKVAADRFRNWASKYCPDAKHMNVGSDTQIRQLFFGGVENRKDENEIWPVSKTFRVPNINNVIEEGRQSPSKYLNITLHSLDVKMQTGMYTATGWPSVSGDALKTFAGKISSDQIYLVDDGDDFPSDSSNEVSTELTSSDEIDTSAYGTAYAAFGGDKEGREACHAIAALCEVCSIDSLISNFILPLQGDRISGNNGRIHCSLNINTETGRLSARRPNLQNQPALEKDRYKIRKAFIAAPGNSLIVADYGQLELRILAHLANCKSMLDAFKAGGDFHSRTAMNMYTHVREAVNEKRVLLEWHPQPGEEKPPVPLLKDAFASERRKAKMLNFSIAYGKTPVGLSRDWKVSLHEAKKTVDLWYRGREEVLHWQEDRKLEARTKQSVHTLLGRARRFPSVAHASNAQRGHIERAAINTPVQGSAADVAMCAMLQIAKNDRLKELKWKLLLQVHDEVILEGPTESADEAKAIVVECMSKPFNGNNLLKVDLSVDAKCAQNWYAAK